MNPSLRKITHETDLCVIGGGMAGLTAAIAAARDGAKVVLVHDRPMLGGNASSEIRMWIRGARGKYDRETGILNEMELENIYRNPRLNFFLWDSVLYEKATAEKNLTLLLNCSCADAKCEGGVIREIAAWQTTTYTWHTVKARYFADCSGDSILAPLVGAEYRVGRESREEYGESIAPIRGDQKTMGMSCLLQARETDRPVRFIPPDFAYRYERDEDFAYFPYSGDDKKITLRDHTFQTAYTTNFWWIELGGEEDSIHDTEDLRDELLKIAFGIWDHIKNRGDHGAENWELEWVGFLPGKRESRRYRGDVLLTQNDIANQTDFPDIAAYGGWPIDDHNPMGMRNNRLDGPKSHMIEAPSPYGIPYRCFYSRNIENLFFAGRNISATHAALSSTRVMATCAVIGQAVGTAAALCVEKEITPRQVYEREMDTLQERLLRAHCFLPGKKRIPGALIRSAALNLSAQDREILLNGTERCEAGARNSVSIKEGGELTAEFPAERRIQSIRLVLDSDLLRQTVSSDRMYQMFAMKCNERLGTEPMRMPANLARELTVLADGQPVFRARENRGCLLFIDVNRSVKRLSIRFDRSWGGGDVNVFSLDVREEEQETPAR